MSSYQSVINCKRNKIQLYFYRNLLLIMHHNKSLSHHNHSIATPNVDYLITESRKSLKSADSRQLSEKDQIESIRKMASFMIEQKEQPRNRRQIAHYQSPVKPAAIINQLLHKADNIKKPAEYKSNKGNHAKLSERTGLGKQRVIKEQKISKKLNSSNSQIISLEYNKLKPQDKQKQKTIFTKNSALVATIGEGQKKLNYARHDKYLNSNGRQKDILHNQKDSQKNKVKKEATKEQVNKIFEGITKRGNDLLVKKQQKLKIIVQERKKQELKGFTFTPNLQSSKNLRNTFSKGFLNRLKDDQQYRQKKRAQIINKQLKKTTFKPELNKHRSSQSTSKIDSFRSQDLPYFNVQSKPQTDFQQILSRLSSSKNSVRSLTRSSVNHESSVTAKTSEFSFFFQ